MVGFHDDLFSLSVLSTMPGDARSTMRPRPHLGSVVTAARWVSDPLARHPNRHRARPHRV
jgi:hypothetical protein